MRRLILVRHSLPAMVPDQPAAAWRLSPEGVERARAFARRLQPAAAACVFSSTEPKAHETARVLAEAWQLPVEAVAGLHEHERPEAQRLSRDLFERKVRDLFEQPRTLVFGVETAEHARQRFTAAAMRLLARSAGDFVVVSHGTVISLFVAEVTGIEPFAFWKRVRMPCAVVLGLPELRLQQTILPE